MYSIFLYFLSPPPPPPPPWNIKLVGKILEKKKKSKCTEIHTILNVLILPARIYYTLTFLALVTVESSIVLKVTSLLFLDSNERTHA